MFIPVLYLSLSIRDPNHVDDNVYSGYICTACNNHPMNYWTYYILHINAFDNLIAPLRHIYLPCL